MEDTTYHKWPKGKSHSFVDARFNKPTFCEYCNTIIWGLIGKQGKACEVCGMTIHHDCVPKIVQETNRTCNAKFKGQHGHEFNEVTFSVPTYCTCCRSIIVSGLECAVCELSCHNTDNCKNKIPIKCPNITTYFSSTTRPNSNKIAHYWIEGVSLGTCMNCKKTAGCTTHLSGFKCFWCRKKVCSYECRSKVLPVCDYGKTKPFRLPPTSLIIDDLQNPSNWKVDETQIDGTPLIVFVNPKSGGQLGEGVMHNMNKVLNPRQIFDLTNGGPTPGIHFMLNNGAIQWRILACGGDGTVAWVLSILDNFKFPSYPPVGVIPLGTGNDLARALGWGGGFSDPTVLPSLVPKIKSYGVEVLLDRWAVTILEQADEQKKPPVEKICNNYFSVGIDAKVALQFHTTRNKSPQYFSNQTVNKMWYAKFGTEAIVDGCRGIQEIITLYIDDEKIQFTAPLEAIVVVNLPSCYGGAFLWEYDKVCEAAGTNKKYTPMGIDDKKLEVVGIKNSFHLGQVQMGLASPIFIGQGSKITMDWTSEEPLPFQIDGEPWLQNKATIQITHFGQAKMFASKDKAHKILNL